MMIALDDLCELIRWQELIGKEIIVRSWVPTVIPDSTRTRMQTRRSAR